MTFDCAQVGDRGWKKARAALLRELGTNLTGRELKLRSRAIFKQFDDDGGPRIIPHNPLGIMRGSRIIPRGLATVDLRPRPKNPFPSHLFLSRKLESKNIHPNMVAFKFCIHQRMCFQSFQV